MDNVGVGGLVGGGLHQQHHGGGHLPGSRVPTKKWKNMVIYQTVGGGGWGRGRGAGVAEGSSDCLNLRHFDPKI